MDTLIATTHLILKMINPTNAITVGIHQTIPTITVTTPPPTESVTPILQVPAPDVIRAPGLLPFPVPHAGLALFPPPLILAPALVLALSPPVPAPTLGLPAVLSSPLTQPIIKQLLPRQTAHLQIKIQTTLATTSLMIKLLLTNLTPITLLIATLTTTPCPLKN